MVGKYDPGTKLDSVYQPIESWLKKLFRKKSKEGLVNSGVDRRDFFRLKIDQQQPLDLCLTMENERVFCTIIKDLSASGFACHIKGLTQIQCGKPITTVFALPIEKPYIIKVEVLLVAVIKGQRENGDLYRFRFYDEIKDSHRDLIHRYIAKKQFEALENNNQQNTQQL